MLRLRQLKTVLARSARLAAFTTTGDNGERKWRVFQDNLKDAIEQSDLPMGVDKLVLQAFEYSKELKSLVVQNEPLEREMIAALTILPVYNSELPWQKKEGDQGTDTGKAKAQMHPSRLSRLEKFAVKSSGEMTGIEKERYLASVWKQILRDQCHKYTEPIATVDPQLFDDLEKDIKMLSETPDIAPAMMDFFVLGRVAKSFSPSGQIQLFVEQPPPDRPDIGLCLTLPSSARTPVVCELGCGDLEEAVMRVLSKCEAEVLQRVEKIHEIGGVVSSKNKWVFLRSQHDRILMDDDPDNEVSFAEDERPTRASLEKIMGKLHSLLSGVQ